jgi:glucose/arabinose dehydrogenase
MARTVETPSASRERRLFVLLALTTVTAFSGLAASDAPVADAAPTTNGYALVEDVTTATFPRMVDFALIPSTTNEAVVVSQHEARVRRVSLSGAFAPDDYGDLSDRVKVAGWEEGLLSLAFSPNFVSDSRVYVYYTSLNCTPPVTRCARISRFQVVNNDMITGAEGETIVLEIDQVLFAENHNGGRLLFGPDGYLYLSVGDGGGSGDALDTGQDHTDLLASVLRIHVTGQATYSIPADNPFVGVAGDDRVWAYGLRNPWRYSFDRLSGDLWLGDVGQESWEEVQEIVHGGNYGWDCWEGNDPFEVTPDCSSPPTPFIFPRAVYSLSGDPCAVVGGYVYRGTLLPEIYGWYVYGDNCSGQIWALNPADSTAPVQLVDTDFNVGSFAELPNGELLVLRLFQPAGTPGIYRLTCATTPDTDGDGQGNACDLDDDNDTWSDVAEATIGTDALDACPDNATDNAWPPDINNTGSVGVIDDIGAVAGDAFDSVPPAPARHDIAPDPPDGLIDVINDLGRVAGLAFHTCA